MRTHETNGSLSHSLFIIMRRGLDGRHIKGLHAEVVPSNATDFHSVEQVVVKGQAGSYYTKSLVNQALISHCHAHRIMLDNQIEVSGRNE